MDDNPLNFQKENIYNKFLPYYEDLCKEADLQLEAIKRGISKAVMWREVRPSLMHWACELDKYVYLNGYRFNKEEHVLFIKLFYDIIFMPGLELRIVKTFSHILMKLLQKDNLLTRDDLQLDWKPLYELYDYLTYKNLEEDGLFLLPKDVCKSLESLIARARIYFRLESTHEILAKCRPLMCVWDTSFTKACHLLNLFLPTRLSPEEHVKFGWGVWLPEVTYWFFKVKNDPEWELSLLDLLTRLAEDNTGYVTFDQYMDDVFNRLLRSFKLALADRGAGGERIEIGFNENCVDSSVICRFLVSCMGNKSIVQDRLDQLFSALESYVHPSNIGSWQAGILDFMQRLPFTLCKRIHIERYRKPTWHTPIPEQFKLTDEDIERFVRSLLPCALTGMFCKTRSDLAVNCLRYLSQLSPNTVIPPVLEKVYSSLETLTEPHRLLQSLKTLGTVILPMVRDEKRGDLRSHAISTMSGILPGLDPNDVTKSLLTLQCLSMFTIFIPIVDCSAAVHLRTDLTQEESDICSATALFEEYVNLYMDRVFAIIQAYSCVGGAAGSASRRRGSTSVRFNAEENSIKSGLYASFRTILSNCSTEVYDILVNRLYNFLVENVLEGKITAEILGELCFCAVRTNPSRSFARFLSLFSKRLKDIVKDENFNSNEDDGNILWYLTLCTQIVRCDGSVLAGKQEELMELLEMLSPIKSKEIYEKFGHLLENLCMSLSFIYICEHETDRAILDKPLEENLPIRHWAERCDIKTYDPKWHEPNDAEIEFLNKIIHSFVYLQLEGLERPESYKKEAILKSLQLIHSCLNGASSLLPFLEGKPVSLIDSSTSLSDFTYFTSRRGTKNLSFDGRNIRTFCFEKLHRLMEFLLEAREDETKCLSYINSIYCTLLFKRGLLKVKLDAQVRGITVTKGYVMDSVVGKKSCPKSLVNELITVQHHKRLIERSSYNVTDVHMAIAKDLLRLSTSSYSEVRRTAQAVFDSFLFIFPYSYRSLLDDIVILLRNDPSITHEQFKGALFLLMSSSKSRSLLVRHDWEALIKTWPAVINAQHSEKPSIVNLLDSIQNLVIESLQSFQIEFEFDDKSFESAQRLWNITSAKATSVLTNQELRLAAEMEIIRNRTAKENYYQLIDILVGLSNDSTLHWRHSDMAQSFLSLLIRFDMRFPAHARSVFVKLLVNDALKTRKMAVGLLAAVLKIDRPRSNKSNVKSLEFFSERINGPKFLSCHATWPIEWGLRPDNNHMIYDPEKVPRTEEQWNKVIFMEKTHHGLYCWPDEIKVYDSKQPECGQERGKLKPEELSLFDALSDKEFVDKMCALMSVEEKEEAEEHFSSTNYMFFQGIFQTYGDTLVAPFMPVMQDYAKSTKEPQQRLASEFICGLLCGQKLWPFKKRDEVWREHLESLSRSAFDNITTENIHAWGTCLATIFDSRDPRKLWWLIELCLELANKPIDSSFNASSRLFLLQGTLNQQEWRVLPLWQEFLKIVRPHLSQPYQNLRDRLGSVLSTIFNYDIDGLTTKGKWKPPNKKEFMLEIQQNLQILWKEMEVGHPSESSASIQICGVETDHKRAILLFKTMLCFLNSHWRHSFDALTPEVVEFFLPLLCYFENETSDDELKRDCHWQLMQGMSRIMLNENVLEPVLKTCEMMAQNRWWKSRVSMLKYLQVCLFSNLFYFLRPPTPERVRKLILALLVDCRVDVRQAASDTLSSLLHYHYLPVNDSLLNTLRQMIAKTNDLVTRHAGILGLSAIVKSSPYTVPEHLPEVLMSLCPLSTCSGPLGASVKTCLADFKRTHQDSWHEHKQKFTDDQLTILTDLLVSPNYYV